MRSTAPEYSADEEARPTLNVEEKAVPGWSGADRDRILLEHPELKDDNWGFIRELLRRRGVKC